VKGTSVPRGSAASYSVDERLAFELLLESIEDFVHLRPTFQLLHVVEPARDVRIGFQIAADQFAEFSVSLKPSSSSIGTSLLGLSDA
jgi:hypothetical protein